MAKEKIRSVESLRFISIIAVVFLHFFSDTSALGFWVGKISRFAVPFFFATSGYFLTDKLLKTRNVFFVFRKVLQRIFRLFIFWYLFYVLFITSSFIFTKGFFTAIEYMYIQLNKISLEELVFGGVGYHLWFFLSLLMTYIFYFLFGVDRLKILLFISVVLYVFGVLGGSYKFTGIGMDLGISTRNYIFFSSLPFFLGGIIRKSNNKINIRMATLLLVSGFLGHCLEVIYIESKYKLYFSDYYFSTFLMGVGVLLIGLNKPKLLELEALSSYGNYTLGIYAVHLIIGIVIRKLFDFESNILLSFLLPVLIILISVVVVRIMKKSNWLQLFC